MTGTAATPKHTPAYHADCCALQTHSTLIKRTSAVTTTVLGEIKIVGLLVLSAVLLGELKCATVVCSAGLVQTLPGGGPCCNHFSLPRSALCRGEQAADLQNGSGLHHGAGGCCTLRTDGGACSAQAGWSSPAYWGASVCTQLHVTSAVWMHL